MFKKILLGILVALVILQFFRPKRNNSGDRSKDITQIYSVPGDVNAILQRACYDCHSNNTRYPWYADLEPVGWWLNDHIVDGKRHFNLNNFAGYKVAVQKKKLEELMDQIKENDMPMGSYTLIHKDALLSEADKQVLYSWCNHIIDTLKLTYPADSLILKREKWHD